MKRKYSQEEVNKLMKGKLYFNRNDTNIFVRLPRALYGWTLNFGNKLAWLVMLLEVAVILGVLWMIRG